MDKPTDDRLKKLNTSEQEDKHTSKIAKQVLNTSKAKQKEESTSKDKTEEPSVNLDNDIYELGELEEEPPVRFDSVLDIIEECEQQQLYKAQLEAHEAALELIKQGEEETHNEKN